jgi:hypothetical protein
MTTRAVFGVALWVGDDEDPIEVSHEELLALRAFGTDTYRPFFNDVTKRFEVRGFDRYRGEVHAFLKEFRAGGAS